MSGHLTERGIRSLELANKYGFSDYDPMSGILAIKVSEVTPEIALKIVAYCSETETMIYRGKWINEDGEETKEDAYIIADSDWWK